MCSLESIKHLMRGNTLNCSKTPDYANATMLKMVLRAPFMYIGNQTISFKNCAQIDSMLIDSCLTTGK